MRKNLYIAGDEDGGVTMQCNLCENAHPVSYHTYKGDRTWSNYPEVQVVYTYPQFVKAGKQHNKQFHKK